MEKFFDAFLYLANWGTHWIMLSMPTKLMDPQKVSKYSANDSFSSRQKGDKLILSFSSEEEEKYESTECDGVLATIAPIRAALMRGDHRALYLGWLLAVQLGEIGEDTLEPSVPPGLAELDAPLAKLVDFLRIDTDLIAAAAEFNAKRQNTSLSEKRINDWTAALSSEEKGSLLSKLIAGDDPHLVIELQQRALDSVHDIPLPGSSSARRTVNDLLQRAHNLTKARKEKKAISRDKQKAKRKREEAKLKIKQDIEDAKERKKRLKSLEGQEAATWSNVHQLISTLQPKEYAKAVSLLQDLRDLAKAQEDTHAFRIKMIALQNENARKGALVERFHKANLIG